jgi:hypothetical protein
MGDTKQIINDINTLFVKIEDISENYINEISYIFDIQISKYQIAINILFLILIVIILYILYRDYVYRIASKMTRCTDINDIIDFNINDNDNSYIYNIYIVHVNNTNNILKDYILRLEYNFIKEKTNITFGDKNIISSVLFAPTDTVSKISNAFSIFDLEEKKKKIIDYYNKDTQVTYNFDKKKLATKKYKYYITSSEDKRLTDQSSILLANFIKKYGYNNNINLDPIYNILYAIENKRNMEY